MDVLYIGIIILLLVMCIYKSSLASNLEEKLKNYQDTHKITNTEVEKMNKAINLLKDEITGKKRQIIYYQNEINDGKNKLAEIYKVLKEKDIFVHPDNKFFLQNLLEMIRIKILSKREIQEEKLQMEREKEKARLEFDETQKNFRRECEKVKQEIDEQREQFKSEMEQLKRDYEKDKVKLSELEKFCFAKINDIPILSKIYADLNGERLKLIDESSKNNRPALRAQERINKVMNEIEEARFRQKEAEYKCAYYEQIIPWLKDLSDEPLDSMPNMEDEKDPDRDRVQDYLSPDEYVTLSKVEKYQRALERYFKRKKTPWEVGRDYERYIGYIYEFDGFDVQYFGIENGLEDLGRDLICTKGKVVHVVQCKYWKKEKTIHEKHINQLFGTTVMYYLSKNSTGNLTDFYQCLSKGLIVPVFYATTQYSETARKFAESLGVKLKIKELEMYPMIKCNVNRATKEKIYHLPFDQQYDKVKIKEKDECYALTVQEAEDKGFKHALRWRGNR